MCDRAHFLWLVATMILRSTLALSAIVGLQATSTGQSPSLVMPGGAAISSSGATLSFQASGQSGSIYAIFADIASGPFDLLGERLYLGLTGNLVAVKTSVMPASGTDSYTTSLQPFAGLAGIVVHGQVVALDAGSSNGLFSVSNAASTALYTGTSSLVATFDDPVGEGYSGSFASDIDGQIRGGEVTTRTVDTIDPQGVEFPLAVSSPLNVNGCRQQVVYRASTLAATGEPELITGIRWRVHPTLAVASDVFPQFTMRLGHTDVVPDYTVDPLSALPTFPDSGLSAVFADNELLGDAPQVVYSGSYAIGPNTILPGRYFAYPMAQTYAYDGQSSLLIDFRVPQSSANGLNGMAVRLMVQSSALPGSRVVAGGLLGQVVDPDQVVSGIADNAMPEFQIDFARTQTYAQSPWIDSGVASPDYLAPVIGKSLPTGTSIAVEYRGADDVSGSNATAWSSSVDVADSKQFLQHRITFVANHLTGERPLVDTLVVPVL